VSDAAEPAAAPWWQRGVAYQIYPRSFQDSNGDGIGDLEGIIRRLDYLKGGEGSLGVDAVWLSPTFPSPMADFGYDVADYRGVDPIFGSLATMDRLVEECHARDIRVLLDFVPNHSSDRHPWFLESRESRDNPKRDWYFWRDPSPDGSPPNNWVSVFGGGAWEWDAATGQYYLHTFLKEQPDLNWRNPEVAAAMHEVLRFWMRRGIDGFRVDALGMALKDPLLCDNPPNPDYRPRPGVPERARQLSLYNRDWPDAFEIVQGLRRVVDEFPGRMLVGEVFGSPEVLAAYYGGEALNGLHLAFNFRLIGGYDQPLLEWNAEAFRAVVDASEAVLPLGACPSYVLGNHDQPRQVTRFGGGESGHRRAAAAAVLLLTLRGNPFIYYGDEIGMEDVPIPPERAQDPARIHTSGRDPERTPMQWSPEPGAGFTTGVPWLPLGDPGVNVQDQDGDPESLLNLYRRLLRLRRGSPALQTGSYRVLEEAPSGVFAYLRVGGGERYLVAVNFLDQPRRLRLPPGTQGIVVCGTDRSREGEDAETILSLAPVEACTVRLR
jgi:alpha-glucosidase